MPLILASVFLLLFAAANPLIEVTLRSIRFDLLLQFLDPWRIGFWVVISAVVNSRGSRQSEYSVRSTA